MSITGEKCYVKYERNLAKLFFLKISSENIRMKERR